MVLRGSFYYSFPPKVFQRIYATRLVSTATRERDWKSTYTTFQRRFDSIRNQTLPGTRNTHLLWIYMRQSIATIGIRPPSKNNDQLQWRILLRPYSFSGVRFEKILDCIMSHVIANRIMFLTWFLISTSRFLFLAAMVQRHTNLWSIHCYPLYCTLWCMIYTIMSGEK